MGMANTEVRNPPCGNCGRPGAAMGSNFQGVHVCNRRCNHRLKARVRNGMLSIYEIDQKYMEAGFAVWGFTSNNERLDDLRSRIKQLKHQLKETNQ